VTNSRSVRADNSQVFCTMQDGCADLPLALRRVWACIIRHCNQSREIKSSCSVELGYVLNEAVSMKQRKYSPATTATMNQEMSEADKSAAQSFSSMSQATTNSYRASTRRVCPQQNMGTFAASAFEWRDIRCRRQAGQLSEGVPSDQTQHRLLVPIKKSRKLYLLS
jgi:hypothetical protein